MRSSRSIERNGVQFKKGDKLIFISVNRIVVDEGIGSEQWNSSNKVGI